MLQRILDAILGKAKADKHKQTSVLATSEVIEKLNAYGQPCIVVKHAGTPQTSKLGGLPEVPDQFEWPVWNGAPLQFLCQLDLREIQRTSPFAWLPEDGMLSFFYDADQSTWGFDPKDKGSWRVFHFHAQAELAQVGVTAADVLPEVFVRFEAGVSLPDPERVGLLWNQVSDDAWDYLDSQRIGDSPCHQFGGWPNAIQNDGMELECQLASNGIYVGRPENYHSDLAKHLAAGAAEWRLLFQLDSDEDAGMQWGDVGRLYFWIREIDALKGDFGSTWMILQCS